MRRFWASLGSLVFFILAPGTVAGFVPWWLTSRSSLRLNSAGAPLDLASMFAAQISDSEAADVINAGRRNGYQPPSDDPGESHSAMPVDGKNAAQGDSEADVDGEDDADGSERDT